MTEKTITAEKQERLKRIQSAKRTNKTWTVIFSLIGIFFLLFIIVLALYILIRGFRSYYPGIFSFTGDGIGNQFFNTIYLVFLSLVLSCLIGIPAGIYMAEYAGDNKFTEFLRISIESLSSLPSIVIGLFGYLAFVLMIGQNSDLMSGWTLMAGALTVSIMSIPLITTSTEDAIRALPRSYVEGSLALGSTHWYAIRHNLMPAATPRIITGVILAAGRAFGEATALMYTAGMSTLINWSNWDFSSPLCPLNPFRPGETLSLHIWTMRSESINPHSVEIANFSSAILVLMVLIFSLTARGITKRINQKQKKSK